MDKTINYNHVIDSSSTEYFEELQMAVTDAPDMKLVYRRYKSVFYKLIDQHTANVRIVFRGPYPKTDYLLKWKKAHWLIRKHVHDTRVRLRKSTELTREELADNYLYDLQSLCEFVALIYDVAIPPSLTRSFPKDSRRNEIKYTAFTDSVRMLVSSWDDNYFYGKIEPEETEHDVRVAFTTDRNNWDYLKELLQPDCQVNLVRPSREDDKITISAEYVIYEPDYLIDISNIAACFEQYEAVSK